MPTPFVKNDPRINRNGRPKKAYCLSQGLRDFMFEKAPGKKKEVRDVFIAKVYELAMDGDIAAMRLILSYTEGIPRPMKSWEEIEREETSDEEVRAHLDRVLGDMKLQDEKRKNSF